jgi:hypothetical protein
MAKLSAPVSLNTETHKIAYCIQDNAGNITKGIYPNPPVACFSATNLVSAPGSTVLTIPDISTYAEALIARITPTTGMPKFGYGISENPTNASCFRSLITNNVTRLISNQYDSRQTLILDWAQPANVK